VQVLEEILDELKRIERGEVTNPNVAADFLGADGKSDRPNFDDI
jgi:hypothetical protein